MCCSLDVAADVPASGKLELDFGVHLEGAGELWIGYGVFEHVTDDVPLTPIE